MDCKTANAIRRDRVIGALGLHPLRVRLEASADCDAHAARAAHYALDLIDMAGRIVDLTTAAQGPSIGRAKIRPCGR